ncbi:hypothetical protein [Caballeronia sp. ATUFL_M2_KS44]|uniref:hypothetical protein n=1 Tax=Caballeronia sp. ATUFL_M2_KS44 TaxID=2921767 RepID=UPI0020289C25|nr:hypothetical protein [Caballeronia sp. ATUFL_M2_KS44]
MNKVEKILSPLVGEMCWGVRQTHGSNFFVEFGMPHLKALGPMQMGDSVSVSQIARRRRRHAVLYGNWTLWVRDCAWEVQAWECRVGQDSSKEDMLPAFESLSGQILESVRYDVLRKSCVFNFDLGAHLTTSSIPDSDASWEQWTISSSDGLSVSLNNNGELTEGGV